MNESKICRASFGPVSNRFCWRRRRRRRWRWRWRRRRRRRLGRNRFCNRYTFIPNQFLPRFNASISFTLVNNFLVQNFASRSRGNLLGRYSGNWNQGNSKGDWQSLGNTPPNWHSKRVMGRSIHVGNWIVISAHTSQNSWFIKHLLDLSLATPNIGDESRTDISA